jgi:hypothetical protein
MQKRNIKKNCVHDDSTHVTFNIGCVFQNNEIFISFLKGSERFSIDLEDSNHLDANLDQEWSRISQLHRRYFYNIVLLAIDFPNMLKHCD